MLFEERLELRKGTTAFCDDVQLGAVLETPVGGGDTNESLDIQADRRGVF